MRTAAEDLRSATNAAAQNALKKKQLQRLEATARQACSAATQLVNASESASQFNRNQPSQQELNSQCRVVLEHVPVLIAAIREARNNPDSVQAVRALIDASKALIQVYIFEPPSLLTILKGKKLFELLVVLLFDLEAPFPPILCPYIFS